MRGLDSRWKIFVGDLSRLHQKNHKHEIYKLYDLQRSTFLLMIKIRHNNETTTLFYIFEARTITPAVNFLLIARKYQW